MLDSSDKADLIAALASRSSFNGSRWKIAIVVVSILVFLVSGYSFLSRFAPSTTTDLAVSNQAIIEAMRVQIAGHRADLDRIGTEQARRTVFVYGLIDVPNQLLMIRQELKELRIEIQKIKK